MRKHFLFSMTCIIVLLLAACGESNTEPSNKTKAAGQPDISGELQFYTSQPDEDAQKLVSEFNKLYPDVKVSTYRSGTEEVVSKLMAEKEAGDIQADVLLVADAITFESLKKDNLLLSYQSPEAENIPETLVDPEGTYSGTKVMATALVINTNNVTSAPKDWEDLLEIEAKDKSLMASPFYSGAAAYNLGIFTRDSALGWDFYESLKDNGMTITKGNGAVLKEVASGEKSYGVVVDFIVAKAKKEGSPVELIYPSSGVPVVTEPIGIMKNTQNEAAAKAFIDFVLSEDGQKVAAELGYTPARDGIPAPEGLKTITEMTVLEADMKDLLAEKEEDKTKFGEIFGQH
ncbi:ABC transporter substrate-binding protein [Lederbergia lenta]|uniref:Family 1 extracellular solute-binding protein n=1 Tax=Lederbergia lenta TaxID=1467 RepID=A0A2X4ZNQ1_LEDLE|nr:ABC transporter substrate-binding protein [Lederbergia lenta]MEC2322916.1 ABC transporter substrate-binding protein [Lederbergia lenta]SQI62034.1 family 1 extracellular solute-binding protein [Lederbergia lenta]